jgi:hypothetical protein
MLEKNTNPYLSQQNRISAKLGGFGATQRMNLPDASVGVSEVEVEF